jgi:hypothetical protein
MECISNTDGIDMKKIIICDISDVEIEFMVAVKHTILNGADCFFILWHHHTNPAARLR